MSAEPGDVQAHVVDTTIAGPIQVVLRGEGPLLLMINGIGGHIGMWEPFAAELAKTRRLVLFDAPGAGSSPPLAKRIRMPGLALFIAELLDGLGVTQVDVLGYSWGGALAQQFAHDFPDRVSRLVLIATVPGAGGRPPKLRVAKAMFSSERYQSPELSARAAATIYGGDYRRIGGEAPRSLSEAWSAHPPSAQGYGQQLFAITGWTSLPWLHRLRPSTLIISGQDDPLVPEINARILGRLIPRSELHVVPGAGHLWTLDHADQSAALIERFLARSGHR